MKWMDASLLHPTGKKKKQTREEMKTRKEPYLVVIEPYF